MCRLAQIDEGRRLRNLERSKLAARGDDVIDIGGNQRLQLLRLVGADESESNGRRAKASTGQKQKEALCFSPLDAEPIQHGAKHWRIVPAQLLATDLLFKRSDIRVRKRSSRAREQRTSLRAACAIGHEIHQKRVAELVEIAKRLGLAMGTRHKRQRCAASLRKRVTRKRGKGHAIVDLSMVHTRFQPARMGEPTGGKS